MSAYASDVLVHAGFGTVFACSGVCARHYCKHRITQFLVGGGAVLIEAIVTVRLVG